MDNNEDLEKLKKSIEEKKLSSSQKQSGGVPEVVTASTQPVTGNFNPSIVQFNPDKKESGAEKGSSEAGQMVNEIFKQGVVHVVSNDQSVQNKILGTAKEVVEDKVEAIKQQATKDVQDSTFDANKDACENYGIEKSVPTWKIKMMRAGSAFWFIIYFIFATCTVAPITIFLKGLTGVIKKTWLAIIVAIVFYLVLAVGIPLLLTLVPQQV